MSTAGTGWGCSSRPTWCAGSPGSDAGAAAEPALRVIETYNAASNDLMVGINERLGYRAMGRMPRVPALAI